MNKGKKTYTVPQVAKMMGLKRQAVNRRIGRGQINGTLLGGRLWVIDRTEVERLKKLGLLKRQKAGRKPKSTLSTVSSTGKA